MFVFLGSHIIFTQFYPLNTLILLDSLFNNNMLVYDITLLILHECIHHGHSQHIVHELLRELYAV